jgi:hypothetical protein
MFRSSPLNPLYYKHQAIEAYSRANASDVIQSPNSILLTETPEGQG